MHKKGPQNFFGTLNKGNYQPFNEEKNVYFTNSYRSAMKHSLDIICTLFNI